MGNTPSIDLSGAGIVLVMVAQVIAIGLTVVLGGFKIGSLRRTVEHAVAKAQVEAYWAVMLGRLQELGFAGTPHEGRFLQGGAQFGNPTTFTHAKTSKELTVQFRDSAAGEVTVAVSLAYLDPIVGDTGESAYRDAVLDYVMGRTDRMVLVPNRSLLAMNSLIGGVLACVLVGINVALKWQAFGSAIVVLALTEVTIGLLALWVIFRKPAEITGKFLALAGIGLSLAALAVAYLAMHGNAAHPGAS